MKQGNYTFLSLKLATSDALRSEGNSPDVMITIMTAWAKAVEKHTGELPRQWLRLHADMAQVIVDNSVSEDAIRDCLVKIGRDVALSASPIRESMLVAYGVGRGDVVWDDNYAMGSAVELSIKDLKLRAEPKA